MIGKFKIFKEMIQELRTLIDSKYNKRLIFVFLSMLVSSGLELLGVAAIMPFISVLVNVDALESNKYIKFIMNVMHLSDVMALLLAMGIGIVVIYILKNLLLLFSRNYQNSFNLEIKKSLSVEILDSIMRRPYSFFLKNNTGALMSTINVGSQGTFSIINCLFTIIAECLTVAALAFFLLATDPVLTLGLVLISISTVVIIFFGFKQISNKLGVSTVKAERERTKVLSQTISGIKDITVMKRRDYFVKKYKVISENANSISAKNTFIQMCPERITETLFIGGLIMIVVYRIRWGMDMTSFVPKLSVFAVAAFRMLPSVNKISSNFTQLVYNKPSLDAAYMQFTEVREYEQKLAEYKENNAVSVDYDKIEFTDSVRVDDISFRYSEDIDDVLKDLSMTIHKGESIGLIGESGAGKSTLGDVILGLLIPEKGHVYMDEHDILTIPAQWSRTIGYVPQSVYLIDDTIRNNIAFGLEESEISDDKIRNAIEGAQLSAFIDSLPDGINTVVGDRGVRLSGGQRQRIAIARSLYYNPSILILDEATSALDNDTEEAVMEAIEALQGSKTLIIIAHRLSTIANCDKVYEIRNGKSVERDKQELLS